MLIKNHDTTIFHLPDLWRTPEARADDPKAVGFVHGKKEATADFHPGPVIKTGESVEVPDWYVEELRARHRGWATRMTPEGIIRRPLRGPAAILRGRIEQRRALRAKHGSADVRFR